MRREVTNLQHYKVEKARSGENWVGGCFGPILFLFSRFLTQGYETLENDDLWSFYHIDSSIYKTRVEFHETNTF